MKQEKRENQSTLMPAVKGRMDRILANNDKRIMRKMTAELWQKKFYGNEQCYILSTTGRIFCTFLWFVLLIVY